jgi:hypothetical protein
VRSLPAASQAKRGRPTKEALRARAQKLADEALIEDAEMYLGGELGEDEEIAAELLTADAKEVSVALFAPYHGRFIHHVCVVTGMSFASATHAQP